MAINIQDKSIKEEIDTNLKEFALYTIYNRAIPSAIDGMKPGQRKLLYGMLQGSNVTKTKVKVADAGSISKYNYHHGEVSAQATAVGMAQAWSNNAPLFDGHGNFGSRKIQEAAAPRYIFITVSKNYEKYFKDLNVAPKSYDPENPEPWFYLPTIPWVLVNGIAGVATGFATKILPRSPVELLGAVKKLLKNPTAKLDLIKPTFPDFKGDVVHVGGNSWKIRGIVEDIGPFYYKITEIPYGDDRAGTVEFLNSLIDAGKINDYDDDCSDKGFEFKVKVSRAQKEIIEKDPIKFFKLEKQVTENLTTLGHDGKIKIFEDTNEMIRYFVEYRLTKVDDSMKLEMGDLELDLRTTLDKIEFISHVVARKFDFNSMTKQQLLDYIEKNITTNEYGKNFVNIPIYQLTMDAIEKLKDDCDDINVKIDNLATDTPTARYLRML